MIKNGKVVDLAYNLTDKEGKVLDKADSNDPFTYLHGSQQIVPGLERQLEGMKVGDKKKISVNPEEGYGEQDPELRMAVKRAQFPAGAELEVGMQFQTRTPDGHG